MNPDPRIALTDSKVKKLLDLQTLAEKLLDGFSNIPRITRNPLPGSGPAPLSIRPERQPLEPPTVKKVKVSNHTALDLPLAALEPEVFTCSAAEQVLSFIQEITHPDSDPLTLAEAKASPDWPKWNAAIQTEYQSLRKHHVFGPLVTTLTTRPVGHKLIFVRKRNDQGEVMRYKVRLVAQGFIQRPGLDFDIIYSPVMDAGTFRYLLGLAIQHALDTQLLDVVTAYLYGPLDAQLYIRPPLGFLPQLPLEDTANQFSGLKLKKALYGLKQARRMWYKHLRDFLLFHKFQHDQALPCLFTLKDTSRFVIITIYVDDLNLVGTTATCNHAIQLLTTSSK